MRDLNRLPTKLEIVIGAIAALIVCAGLGIALYYMLLGAADRSLPINGFYLGLFAALSMAFAWSSALFIRTIFGKPQLPSFRAQLTMGWLMVVGGALLAVVPLLPIFKGAGIRASLHGLAAFTIGLAWVIRVGDVIAHRPNNSFKPNPLRGSA